MRTSTGMGAASVFLVRVLWAAWIPWTLPACGGSTSSEPQGTPAYLQELPASPFNERVLSPGQSARPSIRILVGGHLYGSVSGDELAPARTLRDGLGQLASRDATFFAALGDIVRKCDDPSFEAFEESFADRLELPLFNAVGNHDVYDRAVYEARYGKTAFAFRANAAICVFLDTELTNGDIAGEQLELLRRAADQVRAEAGASCLLVFGHRLIWSGRPAFRPVADRVNSAAGRPLGEAFERDVLPVLESTAAVAPVVWFSGDIGISSSFGLFHHREPAGDLRFVAVGIGDTATDALVEVEVGPSGEVELSTLALAGHALRPLPEYDVRFWRRFFRSVDLLVADAGVELGAAVERTEVQAGGRATPCFRFAPTTAPEAASLRMPPIELCARTHIKARAAARGAGAVSLVLLADGEEVWSRRYRGEQELRWKRIELPVAELVGRGEGGVELELRATSVGGGAALLLASLALVPSCE